ncbi:ribonuclease H-like domain-containing protein [Tanacetum coccineum]
MYDPREPNLVAFKRILCYVRATLDYGLQLYSFTTSSLVAYSCAEWGACPTTRHSTSGYCVFLGNNLLSWSSKRKYTLSRSSAEVEYHDIAIVVAETSWLQNLFQELHSPLHPATIDQVATGYVLVLHVSSRYQYADIFTKGLPSAIFNEFQTSLGVMRPPAPTTGDC